MKKKNLSIALCLLTAFILWTTLIRFIDVQAIGPEGSSVGFATLNNLVHNLTGTNMLLYTITDWLGLVPIAIAFAFTIVGFVQLIKRKNLWKVDYSILALGIFYMFVIASYILFEVVVINYRPVLINGHLEASYPSSTTMLVMCVIPTTALQLKTRIKNKIFRQSVLITLVTFIAFMVIGRLISGVHWCTDIIGGALLSAGLVMMYKTFSKCSE